MESTPVPKNIFGRVLLIQTIQDSFYGKGEELAINGGMQMELRREQQETQRPQTLIQLPKEPLP